MSDTAPEFLPVTELSRQLGSGELRAIDLAERLLARIAALDGRLHAFVSVHGDDTRSAAEAADLARRAGHALGPLHGIPIALKDLVDLQGRITTGGSPVWRERVSPLTATLARRLMAAGMIIIGKTHTVEFAMGGWGTNSGMGTPWNPWDLAVHRAPGGSSAGSGVAVAAGLAPCAIGTDTGGSVRLPCAWNGLTGLKTTIGRISTHGVLPLSPTLDTPGPMCRSVADASMLFNVLQGADVNDPHTLLAPPPLDATAALSRGVAGLRLARLPAAERGRVDAEVLAAYDAAVAQLAALGADIVDLELPHSMDTMGSMVGRIIGMEGYSFVGHLVDDPEQPVDPHVRPRIGLGRGVSAADYLQALRAREALKRQVAGLTASIDAILTPAATEPAPVVADIDQSATPATFTRFVNLFDWCALVLPCGYSGAGLPLSLQVACAGYREDLALRIGAAYQDSTDWHRRQPALEGIGG